MKKGQLRLIPLQADLCLNKQKVDIEDFKGWQDCNAPVYGDCLSPLYKKDNTHHDIFIGEDNYDFTDGTLYKNGTAVLSGAGSKKLKKTKVTGEYSSLKVTEDNLLTWARETASNSVSFRLGDDDATRQISIASAVRLIAIKCFGDSDASLYGVVVWYLHTSGKYGYYVAWKKSGTFYESYGEDYSGDIADATLYDSFEVIAPLIQVAVVEGGFIVSLFGNSGANLSHTEVKNIAVFSNTVYDNPTFQDTSLYPTRYQTVIENTSIHISLQSYYGHLNGRDWNATSDTGPRCILRYYSQSVTVKLSNPLSVPVTIDFYYYTKEDVATNTGKSVTIPAGSTAVTISNDIFNAVSSVDGVIGTLYWKNGTQVNGFDATDTFLPAQIDYDDKHFTLSARVKVSDVTERNNPLSAGETYVKTVMVSTDSKLGYIDLFSRNYPGLGETSSKTRMTSTETISDIYNREISTVKGNLTAKPNWSSEIYPTWAIFNITGTPTLQPWVLCDIQGELLFDTNPSGNNYNTSGNAYEPFDRAYKTAYQEAALKECDCVLDDNRLYCIGDIVENREVEMPTKLFALVGQFTAFASGSKQIQYTSLASFNISYDVSDANIYPKYYAGLSASIQDKYIRILYKFKKNLETEEIIYFGVDSSSIKTSLGKNITLYPGVQKGSDTNIQGGCLNKDGWRLLFNNNMLSNVGCYENENYIGTILADWLSIDTDFHTTFNADKLYYRDNTNVIWCIEKVDSGEEWQYRVIENRYIVLNTTNYFNCYDTQTGLKRHWASDFNNRIMYGFGFTQYEVNATFTNLLQSDLFRGFIITGQNANYERTKDTITSLELGAIYYERCLKDYISFISCDTPYGALEGIDYYRGDDDSTSALYICSYQNGLKYIDTDLTNPNAVYPIAEGGNVRYNPNLFTRFISSYNNKDMVISDGVAYKLLYFNNVVPIMAYYLLDGVESLENAFVLQSTYYGVSKTRLYQMNYNNGVGVEVVCDITNMEYLGALPTQALFWSAQNRAIYAFTGSCIMQLRQYANELENIYGKWYNPATQELFLDTNIGLLVFSDLGTYCLKGFNSKRIRDIFFFTDYFIINLVEQPTEQEPVIYSHYYSYNNKTGYESNHVIFFTKYYGNAHTPITVNNIYIRLYNQSEENPSGYISFKGHTITDIGMQTDLKVVNIGGEDDPQAVPPVVAGEQWDNETGTILIKYTPQYNRGLAFALEVDTTFPIIDIKFDYVEDGGVESQISHINI